MRVTLTEAVETLGDKSSRDLQRIINTLSDHQEINTQREERQLASAKTLISVIKRGEL